MESDQGIGIVYVDHINGKIWDRGLARSLHQPGIDSADLLTRGSPLYVHDKNRFGTFILGGTILSVDCGQPEKATSVLILGRGKSSAFCFHHTVLTQSTPRLKQYVCHRYG